MKLKKLFAIIFLIQIGFCYAQQKAVLSFAEAKQLADRGDARAQAIVAMHYQLGWQTEKDESLAGRYAQASAEAGHPLGIYRLGNLLVSGINGQKDPQTGYKLQAASIQGIANLGNPNGDADPYAQTAHGIMMFQGKVCPQDKVTAVKAYHHAAVQGLAPAMFNYIMAEIEGQGVPKNQQALIDFIGLWDKTLEPGGCPLDSGGMQGKECASCRTFKDCLREYPPAIKFFTENNEKVNAIISKLSENYQPKTLPDEYWKGHVGVETAIMVPVNKKNIADQWNQIIDTENFSVSIRSNYEGMTDFGGNYTKDIEVATKQLADATRPNGLKIGATGASELLRVNNVSEMTNQDYMGRMGTRRVIQYFVENSGNEISIRPNTPLNLKNRMGFTEYPISLEVKIRNKSISKLDIASFGFNIKESTLIHQFIPTILCDDSNTMVIHNFGWPSEDGKINSTLSYWRQKTIDASDKDLVFPMLETKVLDRSIYIPEILNPGVHGGMDQVVSKLSYTYNGKQDSHFFEPTFCRNANDFFTKIYGDTTLPGEKSNYRVLFDVSKEIPPLQELLIRISFDFDKSSDLLAIPFLKINEDYVNGSALKIKYETPRYPFEPKKTFVKDGNGDCGIQKVQFDIINAIGSLDSAYEETICKPLIQSNAKVSVYNKDDTFLPIFKQNNFDGTKMAVLSARINGSTIEGIFEIRSTSTDEIIFYSPWSFSDYEKGSVKLSACFGKNWNWVSWLICNKNTSKLYSLFPGRNPTVFVPTSKDPDDGIDISDNARVFLGSIRENEIKQIGRFFTEFHG